MIQLYSSPSVLLFSGVALGFLQSISSVIRRSQSVSGFDTSYGPLPSARFRTSLLRHPLRISEMIVSCEASVSGCALWSVPALAWFSPGDDRPVQSSTANSQLKTNCPTISRSTGATDPVEIKWNADWRLSRSTTRTATRS